LILQMDRLNCDVCGKQIKDVTDCGKTFPKGTVFLISISSPLENVPLIKHYHFTCNSCNNNIRCLAMIKESKE